MTYLKALAKFVLTLFAASVAIFLLMRAVPGNPARVALGVNATEDAVAELTQTLGLDRPLITQYFEWVGGLLSGSFGTSLSSQQDITPLVLDRAQVSLILVGLAIVLALAGAVPMGMWLARTGNTFVSALTQIGIAVPSFLVGIIMVAFFAVRLGWLPANGWIPPDQNFGGFIARLIMPVISLALVQGAMLTRYVRSSIVDVMDQDYIRTARALGLSHAEALRRHGLRNAALPVLTVTGLQLTTLIVGAVVIESVFVIPGLGSMLLDAVSNRDLTTVQTLVMLLVFFTLAINLATDLAYRVIDPRLKEKR
ncbi:MULTISPECIES: ABC transporter permease [Corynebacterium]|uniref:ABC transporter permease n=1 Tax=Corynebacterium striatum TaxID=43770 RepID=A0ABX7DE70_CORST|nr:MULTISPECIES: ABC transporter permease [Corynebacterium]MDK8788421.1 ABC transporter permease [Corynebacterium striatum]OFT62452.1 ABC transporter permease [Corynebacterium sp. HMSC05D08]QQU76568.1 ABC transporter permease [Corynebacterium striatum]HAT1275790.1 ABC transporter permease [Corynebacterium striatum]HAT1319550.1 ABC transporter permease [Corynebacterium striatum]